jgi:FkbM family methyltransferase
MATEPITLRQFVARSFAQDAALLRLNVPWRTRLSFVGTKYQSLLGVMGRRGGIFHVGLASLRVSDLVDVGHVVSVVIDLTKVLEPIPMPKAPVIVDVGANIGQFCAVAKLLWPEARILSLEADPRTVEVLAQNVTALSGVTTLGVAVGGQEQDLTFHTHKESALSSFRPRFEEWYADAPTQTLHVKPLDALTGDLGTIDLLKIDVEGFEYEVLEGATDTLKRTNWLLVEVSLVGERANLELLDLVYQKAPGARISRLGGAYGPAESPICIDVLFDLR